MKENQKFTTTEFINIIELLLICLSQTEDFDQLCVVAIQWLIECDISQEDFRLAGGLPLMIVMGRRKQKFEIYIK